MMWLRRAMGMDDAKPVVAPTDGNPVGWSSIYPPQVLTNRDPNVSDVVPRGMMTPAAQLGTALMGQAGKPVPGIGLGDAETKANTYVEQGMNVAGATQPIRAFHGSPHTFDRFDLSKIGTGEGAQAYGHGLYFAGNEGVARGYREGLAPGAQLTLNGKPLAEVSEPLKRVAMWIRNTGADPQEIARISEQRAAKAAVEAQQLGLDGAAFAQEHLDIAAAARKLREGGKWEIGNAPNGSMYEVNLRTSPERLLDWDKPLSAQPQQVREALSKLGVSGDVPKPYNGMPLGNGGTLRIVNDPDFGPKMFMDLATGTSFKINQSDLANLIGKQGTEMAGKSAYTAAARAAGGDSAASAALRDVGLDGLQYLDAGSRAAGDGSRNYVMFRDDIVDILRRYGLFGLSTAMGGAAATSGAQAPEQ